MKYATPAYQIKCCGELLVCLQRRERIHGGIQRLIDQFDASLTMETMKVVWPVVSELQEENLGIIRQFNRLLPLYKSFLMVSLSESIAAVLNRQNEEWKALMTRFYEQELSLLNIHKEALAMAKEELKQLQRNHE
jgi:hypothetical protein